MLWGNGSGWFDTAVITVNLTNLAECRGLVRSGRGCPRPRALERARAAAMALTYSPAGDMANARPPLHAAVAQLSRMPARPAGMWVVY